MSKQKKNRVQEAEKEGTSMTTIATIITIIIACLSLIISVITMAQTEAYRKQLTEREEALYNNQSYFQPLNYKITWESTDDSVTLNGVAYDEMSDSLVTELPHQKFTVEALTGGIRTVSALFYRDGECLAIRKIDLSDQIEHDTEAAEDIGYVCEVMSVYPQSVETSADGRKSYFTSIFLVIEGYNNDVYIEPTVLEFGADQTGKLTGEKDVRQYGKLATLYTENKKSSELPHFDTEVLEDLVRLKRSLAAE